MAQEFAEVTINEQGRIVIPAPYRAALGIQPGDSLILRIDDGRLVVETQDRIVAHLHSLFAHLPEELSLVDDLLADRRLQAATEVRGDRSIVAAS